MSLPLVSIGCAVYNGEKTLARALEPLVGQDYPNLEILISDDCSTDGSREIYEEFARKDPRVKVLHNEKNIGITENFNRLFRAATGKYFMWADQDDIRDKTFVSKTLARLEADPEAVLCHSYTGTFMGDPNHIKYITTLHGVDGVSRRIHRYFEFLRYFSDTVFYGLIRSDALKTTKLCRPDLGSTNALLFELLLLGKFIQVPEVLYYYSARGVRNRPDVHAEYARSNPGKKMPLFYFPFLIVARNQAEDIRRSSLGLIEKLELGAVVAGHASVVAATKLVYRALAVAVDPPPESFTKLCEEIVDPQAHYVFLNGAEKDEHLFPKYWNLKGGA